MSAICSKCKNLFSLVEFERCPTLNFLYFCEVIQPVSLCKYYHIFQYKEDLSSDEEIFAEKTKEIESLKENVRQLEEDRAKLINQLQETQTRLKKHEDQLFQQQLQLNQLLLNQGISQGTVFILLFVGWLVVLKSFVSWFRWLVSWLVGWFVTFVSSVSFGLFVSFRSFVCACVCACVRSFVRFPLAGSLARSLVRAFVCSFSFVRPFIFS